MWVQLLDPWEAYQRLGWAGLLPSWGAAEFWGLEAYWGLEDQGRKKGFGRLELLAQVRI